MTPRDPDRTNRRREGKTICSAICVHYCRLTPAREQRRRAEGGARYCSSQFAIPNDYDEFQWNLDFISDPKLETVKFEQKFYLTNFNPKTKPKIRKSKRKGSPLSAENPILDFHGFQAILLLKMGRCFHKF